ncbi:hypothetical protein L1887_53082 [Cichorium endivia]|nr:hypothetical protein L1887_53082 [Cichorium endivia]
MVANMFLSTVLRSRDAAADEQGAAAAAMAAWSAGIAYAINFIILYVIMSLLVVVVVGVMGCVASPRIRKSPTYIILAISAALCICALGVNVSMNKELVVNPQKPFNAQIYTSMIALSMSKCRKSIPTRTFGLHLHFAYTPISLFCSNFRLCCCSHPLPRRLYTHFANPRLFPRHLCGRRGTKTMEAMGRHRIPRLDQDPRIVLICHYIRFVHDCALRASDMATVVTMVNQKQYALIEWTLMLADGLYCTIFFCVKLYELGWGWGEDKHVSRSFLETLRRILISAFACFVLPSFLLITLIVMQATLYRPDIEGYVFVTFIPMTVISAASATLWPAIRAEQHRRKMLVAPIHTLRSQGPPTKFLTPQRSFDNDDEKDFDKVTPDVELGELEHTVVTPVKRSQDQLNARARTMTGDRIDAGRDTDLGGATTLQHLGRPQNPLRHAPRCERNRSDHGHRREVERGLNSSWTLFTRCFFTHCLRSLSNGSLSDEESERVLLDGLLRALVSPLLAAVLGDLRHHHVGLLEGVLRQEVVTVDKMRFDAVDLEAVEADLAGPVGGRVAVEHAEANAGALRARLLDNHGDTVDVGWLGDVLDPLGVRCRKPARDPGAGGLDLVPDVPFVVADLDFACGDLLVAVVPVKERFVPCRSWPVLVAEHGVEVDGMEIDHADETVEHLAIPLRVALVSARDELDRRVDELHAVRPSFCHLGVVGGIEEADLPRAVHLVSKTPVLDVVRLVAASVLAAQVGPVGVTGAVAVFEPRERLFVGAGAHVDAEVGLYFEPAAVVDELVCAKVVGFGREPGELDALGALRDGTDAVLPVVVANEVAAWPSEDGHLEFAIAGKDVGDVLPPG